MGIEGIERNRIIIVEHSKIHGMLIVRIREEICDNSQMPKGSCTADTVKF